MNEHPDIAALLALRDAPTGLEARSAAAHVESCAACRAELARLAALREGLRALPPVPPGPELWARVVAAVEPPVEVVARRSRVRLAVAGIAASAAFAASVALVALREAPGPLAVPAGEATPLALASAEPSIGDLKLRSQRLEAVLAALESTPRVTSARSAGTIAELEDGIALVDYQLAQVPPGAADAALHRALWKKRVELMESLVTVRYAGERADSI